jgi:hypothetical protein
MGIWTDEELAADRPPALRTTIAEQRVHIAYLERALHGIREAFRDSNEKWLVDRIDHLIGKGVPVDPLQRERDSGLLPPERTYAHGYRPPTHE